MGSEFTQIISKEGKRRIEHLQILCAQARSIEEIVLTWVGKGRNLVVSRNTDEAAPALEFAFTVAGETVAFASIPLERILPSYPCFEPLNESMVRFDDQPGFSPDNEWFDQRNARLGVCSSDACEGNVAPAAAVGELILSYALASVGFAEISLGKRIEDRQFLKLALVFFGSPHQSEEAGWFENTFTPLDDLRGFVPGMYWT
ncbi:MAG: hypothetical protein EBZ48_14285 [Proteobacteria bacterium]|nr:hypothetical protein [Pseudomonadota bacterium]